MLCIDNALVAAVEAAERHLVEGIVAASRRRRPSLDAWAVPLAGGVAAYAGPDAPVNKIAGLGFAGVPSADELAAIEQRYHERGAPVLVELTSHADPALVALLAERGYRLSGTENVVGVALPAVARAPGEVVIEQLASSASLVPWTETLLDGFAVPDDKGVPSTHEFPRDVVREMMLDMAAVDAYACFTASVDGVLAGAGGMHVGREVAHMCGAATLPAWRRRGVQSALVRERLTRAAAAGCRHAVTITQPGSTSQHNMQRLGFVLLYVRNALVLPPPA